MADLQTADEFFGPAPQDNSQPQQLPTADEFFAPKKTAIQATMDFMRNIPLIGAPEAPQHPADSLTDYIFGQSPAGRIMNAFGVGAKNSWGTEPLGLSDDTQNFLKKAGVFNDYKDGHTSTLKSFNEGILRGTATALDYANRFVQTNFAGAQAAIAQAGVEIGQPKLGEDIAGYIGTGSPELAGLPHAAPLDVPKARSLGVIGEGEAGYFGTKAPDPVTEADRAQAVKTVVQRQAEEPAVSGTPSPKPAQAAPVAAEAPVATPPDIHTVARQIAPDTFQEYDALSQRQDTFRRWINELDETRQQQVEAEAPHGDEIQDLQSRLDDPDTTKRLAKKYQDRLESLQSERDAYIDEHTQGDSPDMARIRQELMNTDHRMRDIGPDVATAYRQAQEQIGTQEVSGEPVSAEEAPAEQPAPEQETTPEGAQAQPTESPQAESAPVSQTTPEHLSSIATDVSKKLVNAGRPAEEADAAAQLVAAHYQARAERFNGAKGNAYELYAKDAPNIRVGGKAKAKELAQDKTLGQSKRGSITLNNARNTIRLFKDADASTFIHETGHQWLEEMLDDAGDSAATEGIKADAKTVRDWLGVEEGEKVPTKAHEKFARGFERYMMEGVAPSQKLAGVFAKFKDWLTKIYQTVAKLRSPINDDIRGVFDRLLSAPDHEPVIAPERASTSELADIHEAEAENTPPERAAEVADAIRAEIDYKARQEVPEIHDELPHATAGTIPRENPVSDRGGNEAGPVSEAAGNRAESGAVAEGGNEAASEGSDVRAEPSAGRGRATGSDRAGEPNDANERFSEPESEYVDKAGNIRLDNLSTPEDVNAVIRETAADNDNFVTSRRGVLSDGEVLDLADALGMDAATLDARKIGQAFNAEQIIAARRLLIKSASNVRDLMANAATGDESALMAYAHAKLRHLMIQEQVAGITAEAGRALRAFRKLEGSEEADALGQFLGATDARTLNQLKEEAQLGQSLQTPGQVSKFINDTKATLYQKARSAVLEYYINALISGPITHLRYSVGNAINALWTPLVEIPSAAGVGAVMRVLGRDAAQKVYLGEAGAQIYALVKGSRDGWSAAYEAFKSGVSPALPSESHSNLLGPSNAIPGVVGKIVNVPSRSVSAIHSFFKSLRYEQNIQGLAYRTAMKEGLEGDAFNNRIAELTVSPTKDMMDEAGELDPTKIDPDLYANVTASTRDALKELYMAPTNYTSAMGQLNRAINNNLLAKIIVPFMKIGSQITRNAFIERTPLGIFDTEVRNNLLGRNGAAARDMQLGKMAAGTALMGITSGMAAEGMATGDGPSDPRARAVWLLNHRPNTITIGDINIPYQGLGSLGMLMRFSSNMYEVANSIGHEDAGKVAVAALEGFSKSILDDNFMRGVKDALDAVYHPEEYGMSYVRSFVTNWLPFSVGLGQVAREIDPYERNAKGIIDAAKAKIPWVSETLEPRRDVFGEPIPNSGPLPNYAGDPVVQAMDALQFFLSRPTNKIRGIQLTDEQYDDYSRVGGRLAKLQLDQIVSLPGFDQIPAYERFEMMSHAVTSSRETARSMILMQNPDIIQQAINAKIAGIAKDRSVASRSESPQP